MTSCWLRMYRNLMTEGRDPPTPTDGPNEGASAELAVSETQRAKLSVSEKVFRMFFGIIAPGRLARTDASEALTERLRDSGLSEREMDMLENLLGREQRRQSRLASIAEKANAALPPAPKAHDERRGVVIDPDWLVRFVEDSQDVHNEGLQNVYAAILARVARDPGSVSKQTLGTVRYLDADTAAAFDRLRPLVLRTGDQDFLLPREGAVAGHYAAQSVSYSDLLALDTVGLLHTTRRQLPLRAAHTSGGPAIVIQYGEQRLEIPAAEGTWPDLVGYPLTRAGSELARVVAWNAKGGFADAVVDYVSRLRAANLPTPAPGGGNQEAEVEGGRILTENTPRPSQRPPPPPPQPAGAHRLESDWDVREDLTTNLFTGDPDRES